MGSEPILLPSESARNEIGHSLQTLWMFLDQSWREFGLLCDLFCLLCCRVVVLMRLDVSSNHSIAFAQNIM